VPRGVGGLRGGQRVGRYGPGLREIPSGIWALGFVSLFMDVSSEMIHGLLPVYLVTSLHATTLTVGFIEGIAEATASVTKVFSGLASDYLRKRKALAAAGYAMAACTKPIFPLATSVEWILVARFLDRVGKGVRGAPRDALIADLAPAKLRGASYGLRQSLDTVGAFTGPLVAIGLMAASADDFRLVFWIAVLPALAALALILFAVTEPAVHGLQTRARSPVRAADLRALPALYWGVVAVGGVLTLARFSEAFLILRARDAGLALAWSPAVLVLMNVVYALSAYPAGRRSDGGNRLRLLASGTLLLIASELCLAYADGLVMVAVGVVLWGLHMGMTQGLLAAIVADSAGEEIRATAFGVFHLVCGFAMLVASVLAGMLWDGVGPSATFLAGAGWALVALWGLAAVGRR